MKLKNIVYGFCFGFMFMSCGPNAKVGLLKNSDDNTRLDTLYRRAKMQFDLSNYNEAQLLAQKAFDLYPGNEKVSVLLGNIYISFAGFGFYDLAKKLVDMQAAGGKSSANNLLGSLGSILKLTPDNMGQIGTYNSSTNPFFKGLDIYVPINLGLVQDANTPRSNSEVLRNLNMAINSVCAFVPSDVASSSNPRYASCANKDLAKSSSGALLIFAFAHLFEAAVLQTVMFYSSNTTASSSGSDSMIQNSNFFTRANKLNQKTFNVNQIADYLKAIKEFQTEFDAVFNSNPGYMLYEIIHDFTQVINALKGIAGMPASVVTPIQNAVNTLTSTKIAMPTAGSSGASTGGLDNIAEATTKLKQQMGAATVTQVKSSISSYIASQNLTNVDPNSAAGQQKASVCAAYTSLASDQADQNMPTGC